jgi:hypothetical protein
LDSSSFSIITEFAVAIAGFSGIAVAIVHSGGALRPTDRFRTLNLLTWALSAAFSSTFPLVFESLSFSGPSVWRWSSLCFALVLMAGIAVRFSTARSLNPKERETLSPAIWALTIGGNTFLVASQMLNVFAVLGSPSPAPILIGLLWLLAVSAIIFVRLLTVRRSTTTDCS